MMASGKCRTTGRT